MPEARSKSKWDVKRILTVLRQHWDIPDWAIETYDYNDFWIPASSERPAIYYDDTLKKLYIEFPDEYEELPNPYSRYFYPELEEEIKTLEDVEKIKEYLDEETVENIKRYCGDNIACIIDATYDAIADQLEEQLKNELRRIEETKPEYKSFCGVPVIKKLDVYEITKSDGVMEYTAYIPSDVYVIDLDKVPNEETLSCIIEKIRHEG